VAEAMPALPDALVRDATLAHMLAVIEAFATDRIEDGQVPSTPALVAVIAGAQAARDAALERVTRAAIGQRPAVELAYAHAERETLDAIRAERAVLRGGDSITFDHYLAVSHGKQRLGLPASLALARAAGWDARRERVLTRLLDAVWVGLQLHDDVIDWEDDLARTGAWAALIAAHVSARVGARDRETVPVSVRRLVHQSGALARMLQASSRCFRAARRRAQVLGAVRLAAWAGEREALIRDLAVHEAETPGFAGRAHALSGWARTVLR